MYNTQKEKILSIQGLRAVAFLLVFLYHAKFLGKWAGALGVSIFFVISGFVVTYSYLLDINKWSMSPFSICKFGWGRVKKFILLYESLTVMVICGSFFLGQTDFSFKGLVRIISCICLIQAWIPNAYFYYSYIAATWFLSALVFCYFMTVPILKVIYKYFQTKKVLRYYGILGLFGLNILISVFMGKYLGKEMYLKWEYTYIFPVIRLIEYMMGCFLGGVFVS